MIAIHRYSWTAGFSSVWNVNYLAAEIEILKWQFENQFFGGHVTKARDHNECYLQFCHVLKYPLGQKSQRHQKVKTKKRYSTPFHKAHKNSLNILGPDLSVLHFISEKNREKTSSTTLCPKFLIILFGHTVSQTAAVRKWDWYMLEKKTKCTMLLWSWYIHQPDDRSCI